MEMTKLILYDKGLPKIFWGEAVSTTVYLLNRCPTKTVWNRTPFEAWNGRKSSVKYFKVFSNIAYAQVPKEKRHKLDESSEKSIFIRYSTMSRATGCTI